MAAINARVDGGLALALMGRVRPMAVSTLESNCSLMPEPMPAMSRSGRTDTSGSGTATDPESEVNGGVSTVPFDGGGEMGPIGSPSSSKGLENFSLVKVTRQRVAEVEAGAGGHDDVVKVLLGGEAAVFGHVETGAARRFVGWVAGVFAQQQRAQFRCHDRTDFWHLADEVDDELDVAARRVVLAEVVVVLIPHVHVEVAHFDRRIAGHGQREIRRARDRREVEREVHEVQGVGARVALELDPVRAAGGVVWRFAALRRGVEERRIADEYVRRLEGDRVTRLHNGVGRDPGRERNRARHVRGGSDHRDDAGEQKD